MKIFRLLKSELAKMKNLVGHGLTDAQRKMFVVYRVERRKLPPADRIQLDALVSDDYNEEAQRSIKFAFWLAAMRIWQDRPLFFFGGIFCFFMSLLKPVFDVVRSFIA